MRERGTARGWRGVAVLAVLLLAPPALADEERDELGIRVGTGLANLLYVPVKLSYAAGGAVVSGLAWAFSGGKSEVAREVVEPAVTGDYYLTPAHLRRERPVSFVGGAGAPAAEEPAEPLEPADPWLDAAAATDAGVNRREAWRRDLGLAESAPAAPEPLPPERPAIGRDAAELDDYFWADGGRDDPPPPPPRRGTAAAPPSTPPAPAGPITRRVPLEEEVLPSVSAPPRPRVPAVPADHAVDRRPPREAASGDPPPVWVYDPVRDR